MIVPWSSVKMQGVGSLPITQRNTLQLCDRSRASSHLRAFKPKIKKQKVKAAIQAPARVSATGEKTITVALTNAAANKPDDGVSHSLSVETFVGIAIDPATLPP
jgi:hypothetical protein